MEKSAQFNIGSFSSILSIGTEVENEENNSTYPITINGNLPDNNYGFFMMDASGNKSPEAVKVTFDSVDETSYRPSSHIEGYLLTVPNGSVGTYVRQADSVSNVIQPNATLNGSDYYLFNATMGLNDSPPPLSGIQLINFEFTLPNGQKLSESDLEINLEYNSKESFNYETSGWFTIDTHKPFVADGNRANLNSDEKTGFDNLGIDAEDYNFLSSIAEGSSPVYVISSEKATEFANAVSNSNLLGSGGIFALIEDNNNKSGFSVQKLTVGDIALVHFEDKGKAMISV